jgi:hypothetical protein
MNACQDDHKVLERPVPKDIGKTPQESTAGASVPLGVCKRVVRDACDKGVRHFAEFVTQPWSLRLVPVLDSHQVKLGRSTDENRERQ